MSDVIEVDTVGAILGCAGKVAFVNRSLANAAARRKTDYAHGDLEYPVTLPHDPSA